MKLNCTWALPETKIERVRMETKGLALGAPPAAAQPLVAVLCDWMAHISKISTLFSYFWYGYSCNCTPHHRQQTDNSGL